MPSAFERCVRNALLGAIRWDENDGGEARHSFQLRIIGYSYPARRARLRTL